MLFVALRYYDDIATTVEEDCNGNLCVFNVWSLKLYAVILVSVMPPPRNFSLEVILGVVEVPFPPYGAGGRGGRPGPCSRRSAPVPP